MQFYVLTYFSWFYEPGRSGPWPWPLTLMRVEIMLARRVCIENTHHSLNVEWRYSAILRVLLEKRRWDASPLSTVMIYLITQNNTVTPAAFQNQKHDNGDRSTFYNVDLYRKVERLFCFIALFCCEVSINLTDQSLSTIAALLIVNAYLHGRILTTLYSSFYRAACNADAV